MTANPSPKTIQTVISKARGCLLGQLAGDSLGSLVEFQSPEQIKRAHPGGVRKLTAGGFWNTLAGQPTDDSEMALSLARILVKLGTYEAEETKKAYVSWLNSKPFDIGATTAAGLKGQPKGDSQANGALMRISPLGIFGTNYELWQVATWAKLDAAITHPNTICQETNALFAMAIASAIKHHQSPQELYQTILNWAKDLQVNAAVMNAIEDAATTAPQDYVKQQGWVLIAFQNALWQLLHADNLEEAIVDTIMRGGDTDTNAAICGALLGAVYGIEALPEQWIIEILNCRPWEGSPGVHRPRPMCFWPVDALKLAERLVLPVFQE